jgi:hypothetical protein
MESPDSRRTVSTGTGTVRTILVVAALVLSAASIGVVTVTGSNDGVEDDTAAIAVQGGSNQQQTPVSGTQPLTDVNTTFSGASANDTFGSSLAHGDLNDDGVADVVVGAPRNDSAGGNNSGAVYVFYGPVNDSEMEAESADVTLHGVEAGDRAGYSVATGDADDDGVDDLVVGAPLLDLGAPTAGAAYVLYGGDLPENASLSAANHTLVGEREGDRAGWSVATVNRSGGDDVLVGAPQNSSDATDAEENGDEAGAAYVVSDLTAANGSLANASAVLTGEAPGDRAGWSVADTGDFDGDSSADLVVSAPRNNSTGTDAGLAYVVTENVSGTMSLADAALKLAGDASGDRAGWATAGARDVNGDGYDDLVVGAPFAETADSDTNAGVAYVVYGGDDAGTVNLSESGAMFVGEGEDDFAGYDVAGAESSAVNCDDYGDVVVGAPGNNSTGVDAGAAYVVAGSQYLPVERNLSTADSKLLGESEGDRAGNAVADAGNASGNGTAGVLVGAPLNESSGVDAGAAYLVADSCPEPVEPDDEDGAGAPATATEDRTTTKDETTTEESTTTDETTTDAPTTADQPTTDAPTTTEQPTTDAPTTTEQPTTNAPTTTEQPTNEEPTTEVTTTEEPTTTDETTTDTTTTTTSEEPQLDIDASSPECGVLEIENPTDERVYIQFTYLNQPSNEGEFILGPGESERFDVGEGRIELTASTESAFGPESGERVLVNGNETTVVDVSACDEESPPVGGIVDVTCQDVTLNARNISQGALTFLVFFGDGTSTTRTVETENGEFSGVVPYDNPDSKNISGVLLFAGNDTEGPAEEFLDDVDLDGLPCGPNQPTTTTTSTPTTTQTTTTQTTQTSMTTATAQPTTTTAQPTTTTTTAQPTTTTTTAQPTTTTTTTTTSQPPTVDAVDFRGCSEVWIVFEEDFEGSVVVDIQIYNAVTNETENVERTIDMDDTETIGGQYGDQPVYKFNVHSYVGESDSGDSKIRSVSTDGETYENQNNCADNVPDNVQNVDAGSSMSADGTGFGIDVQNRQDMSGIVGLLAFAGLFVRSRD